MPLVVWSTIHRIHGPEMTTPFPHPSGEFHVHCCPCGSRHISLTPAALAIRTEASLKARAGQ